MEKIKYMVSLDLHKSGYQKTLQGFRSGESRARELHISLTEDGQPVALENVDSAMVYVYTDKTKDNPNINEARIENNSIVYGILPTDVASAGIVHMMVKLIRRSDMSASISMTTPEFSIEVLPGTSNSVEQTQTFSALEQAVAFATEAYNHRIIGIEYDDEYVFRIFYADGTIYENDDIKDVFNLSAKYAQVTQAQATIAAASALACRSNADEVRDLTESVETMHKELMDKIVLADFKVDFATGDLTYESLGYNFLINQQTGNLEFTEK